MEINEFKTEEIIVQKRKLRDSEPPKTPFGEVKRVDNAKILGIQLDNSLTFSNHVMMLSKKRTLKFFF